jgi:hypothetical protein
MNTSNFVSKVFGVIDKLAKLSITFGKFSWLFEAVESGFFSMYVNNQPCSLLVEPFI